MDYGNGNIGVMKMWKCKKCGGRKFEIDKRIIDRDKKSTLNIKDINGSVMCCNCYNLGKDIYDIATWEEEEDEN